MPAPAVRFIGIGKRFPGTHALRDVSFEIAKGSCHAICGENGAGKSTLGKILTGLHQADSGTIELDGRSVRFRSPREALAAGVAMVHQELAFCGNLTVADNLCLRALPNRAGLIDRRALHERALAVLRDLGATIDPGRLMSSLSVAEQQVVQIASAVSEGARLIVFDEPTSSLGEIEAKRLYAMMASLKARGVTQIFVSHRMPEIFALCDTISVLRDGQHVATQATADINEATLIQQMIGRSLGQAALPGKVSDRRSETELLRLSGFSSPGRFRDITLTVHAGEIIGLAGLVGAGRSEIARAVFGLDPHAAGTVHIRGAQVRISSPRDALRFGIGFVPEDRKQQGLVLGMRARENATLPSLENFSRRGWVSRESEAREAQVAFTRMGLKSSSEVPVDALSGGNQQKVVLSRWLTKESQLLILDEPTRGVDVGAKAEIHAWIAERAAAGTGILLISSELPELLALASRVLVMREGEISGELPGEQATQEAVLKLMTGFNSGLNTGVN
ncbi:MAG: sugar ABC transporter ATP-binding protein [Gemmatimonadaceae bacterium]|nr:sugar ABC transporter ATP-binding protein [Gemmatimonadaceae bacterium]